jgi:glucose/mannose transport system permease protein
MTENNYRELENKSKSKKTIYRWILFSILGVFALYYITPLYVMLVTSFKTMEEIRQGNLFSLPSSLNLESWDVAWNGQGFSAGDVFLKTYFWNSVKLVVPAVIISTIIGAINGYALTKWRFKGDSYIFLLFLFWNFYTLSSNLITNVKNIRIFRNFKFYLRINFSSYCLWTMFYNFVL